MTNVEPLRTHIRAHSDALFPEFVCLAPQRESEITPEKVWPGRSGSTGWLSEICADSPPASTAVTPAKTAAKIKDEPSVTTTKKASRDAHERSVFFTATRNRPKRVRRTLWCKNGALGCLDRLIARRIPEQPPYFQVRAKLRRPSFASCFGVRRRTHDEVLRTSERAGHSPPYVSKQIFGSAYSMDLIGTKRQRCYAL